MRILIAEDEKDLNRMLVSRLETEHYSVDSCFNGQEALEYLESAEYDAAVLDIMMPVMDGLTVLRQMRRKNISTPVLLLTAKDSIEDRVNGLDAGANDYLVKPFAFEELSARIRVLLRKPAETPKTCYRVGDLEVPSDVKCSSERNAAKNCFFDPSNILSISSSVSYAWTSSLEISAWQPNFGSRRSMAPFSMHFLITV